MNFDTICSQNDFIYTCVHPLSATQIVHYNIDQSHNHTICEAYGIKIKLRSFKSSKQINEKQDVSYAILAT